MDHAIDEGFTGAEMRDERAIQEGELVAWPAGEHEAGRATMTAWA